MDLCECPAHNIVRVDRRQPHELYKHVVYGLYLNGELQYIGVSGNYFVRFHQHLLTKNFDEMRIIRSFKKRSMADEFEKTAICGLRPPINILYEPIDNAVTFPKNGWNADLRRF